MLEIEVVEVNLRVKLDGLLLCRSSRLISLPVLDGGLLDARLIGRLAGLLGMAAREKRKALVQLPFADNAVGLKDFLKCFSESHFGQLI